MDEFDQWVVRIFEQKNNEIIRNVIHRPVIPRRVLTDFFGQILMSAQDLIKSK
jgi:hypothetical protein